MPVKTITHPDGRTFKLGRRRPRAKGPSLSLKNYLMRSFVPGPVVFDYTAKAKAALAQMYMNATRSCCVEAGIGHHVGVFTGNATGTPFVFTDQQILAMYSAMGGYDPSQDQPDGSNPTDQGTDIPTALAVWQQKGLLPDGSHKIVGSLALDAADPVEVRTAAWLFEGLIFGVELPDAWIQNMPSASGFTWGVAGQPDPENGHCFLGAAFEAEGPVIDTWGMLGILSYAAMETYAISSAGGELHCVLTMDAINTAMNKAPVGVDFTMLRADLQAIGGITQTAARGALHERLRLARNFGGRGARWSRS